MKKVFVIAEQTLRGYSRDRFFHSVLLLAVLLVLFSVFLSTLAIAEERKILLDFGFSAISIEGIGFSLLLGSTVVRKEVDARTIYTVLSKPVKRREYLLGKFLGAAAAVTLVHLLCGGALAAVLLALGTELPPGFFVTFYLMILESVLVLALALVFSLGCSSLLLGAALATAGFLIGRSNYSFFLMSKKASSEATRWLFTALYSAVPSLQRFDIREVVAYGKPYPEKLVGVSSVYFLAYVIVLLVISHELFRRKDLP